MPKLEEFSEGNPLSNGSNSYDDEQNKADAGQQEEEEDEEELESVARTAISGDEAADADDSQSTVDDRAVGEVNSDDDDEDINEWPVIDPLPSYGHGRDKPGGRYISLIAGSNLTDVIITGDNGTIDGQGSFWWQKFHRNKLKYTPGYLVELMYSDQIFISNLTFVNSPAWNIHPVYSRSLISGELSR